MRYPQIEIKKWQAHKNEEKKRFFVYLKRFKSIAINVCTTETPSTSIARIKIYDIASIGLLLSEKKTLFFFGSYERKQFHRHRSNRFSLAWKIKNESINFFSLVLSPFAIIILVFDRFCIVLSSQSSIVWYNLLSTLSKVVAIKFSLAKLKHTSQAAKVEGNGQWEMYLRHSTEK